MIEDLKQLISSLKSSDIISIISLVFSAGFGLYNVANQKKSTKKQEIENNELKKRQMDLDTKVIKMELYTEYNKIREKRVEMEIFFAELLPLINEDDKNKTITIFHKSYTSYIELFNSIESFCRYKINYTNKEDEFDKKIAHELYKLAKFQYEIFKTLDDISVKIGNGRLRKPSYNDFKEYDTFLQNFYNEDDWKRIIDGRKANGFI